MAEDPLFRSVRRLIFGCATLAVLALLVWPFVANPYLPLEDLPNHIARRYIEHAESAALEAYYRVGVGFGTNQAADILYRPLAEVMEPEAFSRVTMGLAALSLVVSALVLNRVLFGRWSGWPLVVSLIVLNAPFAWGFENYVLTVPLAILGFAAWVGFQDRSLVFRLCVLVPFVVTMYLGHVFAFLAFVILVVGHMAGRVLSSQSLAPVRWAEGAVILAAATGHLAISRMAGPAGFGNETRFGDLRDRIDVFIAVYRRVDIPSLSPVEMAVPALFSLVLIALALKPGWRPALHTEMRVPLICLGLTTLAMPTMLTGVDLTHLRFGYVFAAVFAASLRFPSFPVGAQALAALALVGLLALRMAAFNADAARYSAAVADLRSVASELPPGARVISARGEEPMPATRGWHTAAYLVPFAESFVPTLFVAGSHGIEVLPEWQGLTNAQPMAPLAIQLTPNFALPPFGWPDAFTHLLLIGAPPEGLIEELSLAKRATAGLFHLYEIE